MKSWRGCREAETVGVVTTITVSVFVTLRTFFVALLNFVVENMTFLWTFVRKHLIPNWPIIPKSFRDTEDEGKPRTVNVLLGFFFMVNFILGTGFLGIPYGFFHGGIIAGTLTMIVVGTISWLCALWMLDSMARSQVRLICINCLNGTVWMWCDVLGQCYFGIYIYITWYEIVWEDCCLFICTCRLRKLIWLYKSW